VAKTVRRVKVLLLNYREDVVAEALIGPEEIDQAEKIRKEYEPYFYATKIVSYIERREKTAGEVGTLLGGKSSDTKPAT
jgi:hypothetical protein